MSNPIKAIVINKEDNKDYFGAIWSVNKLAPPAAGHFLMKKLFLLFYLKQYSLLISIKIIMMLLLLLQLLIHLYQKYLLNFLELSTY